MADSIRAAAGRDEPGVASDHFGLLRYASPLIFDDVEISPRPDCSPNDEYLTITLGYAFEAVLSLLNVFWRAFDLDGRERLDALRVEFKTLKPTSAGLRR